MQFISAPLVIRASIEVVTVYMIFKKAAIKSWLNILKIKKSSTAR
jgi:hypothetical protein